MEQESDVALAKAAMPSSLKTLEGLYVAAPDNRTIVLYLAAGYCGYAGFVQDDWEAAVIDKRFQDARALADHAARMFTRCMNYGLRLLGPRWQETIYGPARDVQALLPDVPRGSASALLWTAVGLAGVINMKQSDMAVVAHLSKVELLFQRVLQLDESLENAMAHLMLGALACGAGAGVGGRPEEGEKYFERARALTEGRFLTVQVMHARLCGVSRQDRVFFRQTLQEVLRTPPSIWPEQRLANELAHLKARRYLQHESDWF